MKETIEVDLAEFKAFLDELVHLRNQRDDLQLAGRAAVELRRENDIAYQVAEFHYKFGFPVRTIPTIPGEEETRFRLKLIAEEFLEVLRNVLSSGTSENPSWLPAASKTVMLAVETCSIDVDIVGLADNLADLDYVVQGTRAQFGIPRAEVAREVHRANLAKVKSLGSGYPGVKPKKPEGWKEPDIRKILRERGWAG